MSMAKFVADIASIIGLKDAINAGVTIVFPPLKSNSTGKGKSTITKIGANTIYFERGNSEESVKIVDLINAYDGTVCNSHSTTPHTPIPSSELDQYFIHECAKTFFLQLLKYFGLAEIEGSGKKGDPYKIV